jgi:hypothetical protein
MNFQIVLDKTAPGDWLRAARLWHTYSGQPLCLAAEAPQVALVVTDDPWAVALLERTEAAALAALPAVWIRPTEGRLTEHESLAALIASAQALVERHVDTLLGSLDEGGADAPKKDQ